jgi:hypothetical protein
VNNVPRLSDDGILLVLARCAKRHLTGFFGKSGRADHFSYPPLDLMQHMLQSAVMAKSSKVERAMKHTTIRLPEELLKRAKIYAIENGTSLQALIVEGLTAGLECKRSAPREGRK